MSRGLGFCAMIVPGGGGFAPFESCPVFLRSEEWFWMKLTAALMCSVAGPDHNPTGEGQLPYPNECNSVC